MLSYLKLVRLPRASVHQQVFQLDRKCERLWHFGRQVNSSEATQPIISSGRSRPKLSLLSTSREMAYTESTGIT